MKHVVANLLRQHASFLFQVQYSFRRLMQDLIELLVGELQLHEPLHLGDGIPEGGVGAVGHAFGAVGIDVVLRLAPLHEHQGGGGVENAVGVPEQLPGGVEHPVAAEMGGDDLKPGEQIQHPAQPGGVGVRIPGIAHVEHCGDAVAHGFIHREEPLVVDVEALGVWVHLDAPQTQGDDPLQLVNGGVHGGVEGAEADEILMELCLGVEKIVDGLDPVGGVGHREHHIAGDTGLRAPAAEHFDRAVHVGAVELVEIPDGIGGLPGYFFGVDVIVNVDDLQEKSPRLVGLRGYYTPLFSEKQGFPHGDFVTEEFPERGYTVVTKKNKEDYNMSAVNIDLNNFHQEVMNSDKPVLLDFWAPWCGPCRMVVPMVEAIAEERPDIKVGKINIDEQYELANQFGIMSIPTLMVVRDGKVVRKAMGARPKQAILELLQ